MSDLQGPAGELRFTLTIKRAATGKEETFEMTSGLTEEQLSQLRSQMPERETSNQPKE